MARIEYVTVESNDPQASERLHDAMGVTGLVRTRGVGTPPNGFRGFTLSLIASGPGTVDNLLAAAQAAGATIVVPPAKALWGYGGTVRAQDGTVWSVASSSKEDKTPPTDAFDSFVLQFAPADVVGSKQFFADRGFPVAKSYGKKYVEFDTGRITLALTSKANIAKVAGSPEEGSGPRRLAVATDVAGFTDPDGFVWESAAG